MPRFSSPGLFELEGFTELGGVASRQNVRLSVIGSLPRRLFIRLHGENFQPRDLFDFVPFTSDIDVVHDGQLQQTTEIVRDIAYSVPFSEMLRWQVASEAERERHTRFLATAAHLVPDSRLTLDADGIDDPYGASEDYRRRQLRFVRNPNYERSELFQDGDDIPIFPALLWVRNAFELVQHLPGFHFLDQDALQTVSEVVWQQIEGDVPRRHLQASSYLRSRLIYLFTSMALAAPSMRQFDDAIEATGLRRFVGSLYTLDNDTAVRVETAMGAARLRLTSIVPATVGEGTFRSAPSCQSWNVAEFAQEALGKALRVSENAASESDVALLSSDPIEFVPGIAACSESVPDEMHEFLHLHVPLTARIARTMVEIPDESLSVAIALGARADSGEHADLPGAVFVLPSVCTYRYQSRQEGSALQIRINMYGVLAAAHEAFRNHEIAGQLTLRVFIIRPTGVGDHGGIPGTTAAWRAGNEDALRPSLVAYV